MIYLYLPEGLSIRRYVQVLPLNMVCFIAIKKMNTKEWLVYTKLTIRIVNLAVKRERAGSLPGSVDL